MYSDSTNTQVPSVFVEPESSDDISESQELIAGICDEIKEMLLEKNRKYGDSALNPSRIFSRSDAVEQIKVRIDDKLTRLRNMQEDEDEDVVMDLMGYLVLLLVAQRKEDEKSDSQEIDWSELAKQFPNMPTITPQPWIYPTVTPQPYYPQPWDNYTINHYNDGHDLECAIQNAVQTINLSKS